MPCAKAIPWAAALLISAFVAGAVSDAEARRAEALDLPFPVVVASYSAEFYRRAGSDIEQGVVYFKGPSLWRLDLSTPIRQTLAGTDSLLLVYYPDDRRALRIGLSAPMPPPSHLAPVFLMDPPTLLERAEFSLTGFRSQGDTTVTRWGPTGQKGAAVWIELYAVRGCTTMITWLGDSGVLKRIMLSYASDRPDCLTTEIVEVAGADTVITKYWNAAFDVSLDDSLFVPLLPKDTSVKEYEW